MVDVMTVLGPVPVAYLGVTLIHEHLVNDGSTAWRRPDADDAEGRRIAESPVRVEFLGRLREDPYLSRDNCNLDDPALAAAELGRFVAAGGSTIVEQTVEGIGRDPQALRRISESSGANVVMGCGLYLERSHPRHVARMSADAVSDHIERDIVDGVGGVHAGVIGEIGVGPAFSPAEEKALRGAVRAQRRAGVPLSVHLPGWQRHGHRVLDIVAEEDADPSAVVLSHLNPSHDDPDYQRSLADRGAWLSFDMVGMELHFPGEGQSPSDEETARVVAALIHDGYAGRLLLSHDVFLKTLLRAYGGFGYDHILVSFLPRLARHQVPLEVGMSLLVDNPRAVFEAAAKGAHT